MLKKSIASLLILSFISPVLAGPGPSRLADESDNERPLRRESAKPSSPQTYNSALAITVGTGIAIAGGLFAAYKMSSTSSSKNSNYSEERAHNPKPLPKKLLDEAIDLRDYNKDWQERSLPNKIYEYQKEGQTSPSYSSEEENSLLKIPAQKIIRIPTIDMSIYLGLYDEPHEEGASRLDLHPVYNNNPRKYLRDWIYKCQKKYHRLQTKDNKMIRIITGTGKKRPGPNYRLQESVRQWLQEPYIQRRIKRFYLEDEGMFNVFLRKDLC